MTFGITINNIKLFANFSTLQRNPGKKISATSRGVNTNVGLFTTNSDKVKNIQDKLQGTNTTGGSFDNAKPIPQQNWNSKVLVISGLGAINSTPVPNVFKQKSKIKKKNSKKYSEDILDVSTPQLLNKFFQPEPNSTVSVYRPEIISILNFAPLFNNGPKSSQMTVEGRFFELQHQASYLRRDTLKGFLTNVQKATADDKTINSIFNKVQTKLGHELKRADNTVKFYKDSIDNINELESYFDLKTIDADKFESKYFLSLEKFYEQKMGFTKTQYDEFTNTKLLFQLLADFKAILENYSFGLLTLKDSDRPKDKSPTTIDTTYTINDGFSFTTKLLQSENVLQNAMVSNFFNAFVNSLPSNPANRVKVLINLLSKEYRISRALGSEKLTPNNMLQMFDIPTNRVGSPFDNIVGVVGKNIFEPPLGDKSLSTIGHEAVKTNVTQMPNITKDTFFVLPFEAKYVDSEQDKKVFISGLDYFITSIFDLISETDKTTGKTNTRFNTGPLINYSNDIGKKITNAEKLLTILLGLDENNVLDSFEIYKQLLLSIKNATNGLKKDLQIYKDSDQEIINAIFHLCAKDNKLKNLFFQYLLLVGLQTNNSNQNKTIWDKLAREISNVSNFPNIKVPSKITSDKNFDTDLTKGPTTVMPFIEQIAENIEIGIRNIMFQRTGEVFKTLNQSFNTTSNTNPNASLGVVLDTDGNPVNVLGIREGDIKSILVNSAKKSNSSSGNSLIKEYINIVSKITSAASAPDNKYLLDDGRTRVNFLSPSTQLLVAFEMLVSLGKLTLYSNFIVEHKALTVKTDYVYTDLIKKIATDLSSYVPPNSKKENFSETSTLKNISGGNVDDDNTTTGNRSNNALKALKASDGKAQQPAADLSKDNLNKPAKTNGYLAGLDEKVKAAVENALKGLNQQAQSQAIVTIDKPKSIIQNSITTILNKLADEDLTIQNILYLLRIIKEQIHAASKKADHFYGPKLVIETWNKFPGVSVSDMRLIKHESQVRTTAYLLDAYKQNAAFANEETNVTFSRLVNGSDVNAVMSNIVPDEVKEAVYSYLSQGKFLKKNNAETKIKVFSIGIPAQFSESLRQRVKTTNLTKTSFLDKQTDVLKVNVYKRDIRFDDIVFKPQSFVFDLSLFQHAKDVVHIKPTPSEKFSKLELENVVVDYTKILDKQLYGINPVKNNVTNILTDKKYSFLNQQQKRSMINNHFVSFLLENYIQLLTGIVIREDSFFLDPARISNTIDGDIQNLVVSYLRTVLKENLPNTTQSIQDVLANPNVSEDSKDLVRLITSGTITYSPQKLREQIVSPKIFDRVFNIPVDISSFEIDETLTKKTTSGKSALKQAYLEQYIVRKKVGTKEVLLFKPKTNRDIVFEEYFINIQTTND